MIAPRRTVAILNSRHISTATLMEGARTIKVKDLHTTNNNIPRSTITTEPHLPYHGATRTVHKVVPLPPHLELSEHEAATTQTFPGHRTAGGAVATSPLILVIHQYPDLNSHHLVRQ